MNDNLGLTCSGTERQEWGVGGGGEEGVGSAEREGVLNCQ